jgi:hypothetical protein
MNGWFAIGISCIISGYIFFNLTMPTDFLAADFFTRMQYATAILIVFTAIGGFFCLLGFIRLIQYYKLKD